MRVVTRTRTAAAAACAVVVVAVTDGAGSTETLVERGAYLVTTVAACGNCHTPRDASGKPMAKMTLAGRLRIRRWSDLAPRLNWNSCGGEVCALVSTLSCATEP